MIGMLPAMPNVTTGLDLDCASYSIFHLFHSEYEAIDVLFHQNCVIFQGALILS